MLLGRYEVVGELGRGGSGTVFRARSPEGTVVAVKVLAARTEEARTRFERERRLLGSLGEGFVPLLDHGETAHGPFIVMPFVGGGTLRDRLVQGPLAVEEVRLLGVRLAGAIGRAHAAGIVHRDLKPENILYTEAGEPLVADLGLAKHFDKSGSPESLSLSTEHGFRGTAGYMSPEQVNSSKDADSRTDVFALACVLYEALTGEPAFRGDTLVELFERLMACRFTPLRAKRPEVPRGLARVIERGLALDTRERFQEGAAFAEALRAAGRETNGAGARAVALALGGGGVALLLLAAVLALVLGGPRSPERAPATPSQPISPPAAAKGPPPPPAKPPALDARAHFARARALTVEKKPSEAFAEYSAGLEMQPDVDAYIERGQLRERDLGDLDGAFDDYSASTELDSTRNARGFNFRGSLLSRKGNHEAAIMNFTRAIEIDPKYALAWANRGAAYTWLKQEDAAIENYTRAIDLDGTLGGAYGGRGSARFRKNDFKAALPDVERAAELDPRDIQAHLIVAAIRIELKDYELAVGSTERVLRLDPTHAAAWQLLGVAKAGLGDLDGACAAEDEALQLNPASAPGHFRHWSQRAAKRAAAGDVKGAIADLEVFLGRAPPDDEGVPAARAKLAQLRARAGE